MTGDPMIPSPFQAFAVPTLMDHFSEQSKLAGYSGRLILSINPESNASEIRVARESFGDRVLRFLSDLPYLKNTEFVKSYCKQLKSENRLALALFVCALSTRYGSEALAVSFQRMWKEVGKKGLNERTIRKLVNISERYSGLGQAKASPRNVAVHIWPYKDTARPGHTSVTVSNQTDGKSAHISWWPNGKRQEASRGQAQTGSVGGIVERTQNLFAPHFGLNVKSIEKDRELEVGSADTKLQSGEEARAQIRSRIAQGTWHANPPLKAADVPEAKEKIFRLRLAAALESDPKISSKIKAKAEDLKLEVAATVAPRAEQMKDPITGKWGVVSEKVYLPLSGPQVSVGADGIEVKKFALFGLNEQAMFADADTIRSNAHAYGEIRKAADDAHNPALRSQIQQAQAERQLVANEVTARNNAISKLSERLHESKSAKAALYESTTSIAELRLQEAEFKEQENALSELHKENRHALKRLDKLDHKLAKMEVKMSPDSVARKEAEAEAVGPEIGYQFASTTNNCAGMVLRMVRAGGADDFVRFTDVTDALGLTVSPDEKFTGYMIRLQKELDGLNARADDVMSRLQADAPVAEGELLSRQGLEDFIALAAADWVIIGDVEEKIYDLVVDGLQANLINPGDNRSQTTEKMKSLLEIAEQVYALEGTDSQGSPKVQQLKAQLNMAFLAYKAHVALESTSH